MGSRNHIIATSTEFEIGTGGDYSNLNTALDDLMYYHVDYAALITWKLIAGFTPVNFVQRHPQGYNIIIDLNGQNYRVASSVPFSAPSGYLLRIKNTGADCTISTSSNGTGSGVQAYRGGAAWIEATALNQINIGENGYGFLYGLYAYESGSIYAPYVGLNYNGSHGAYSVQNGFIANDSGQANYNGGYGYYSNNSRIRAGSVAVANNTNGGFYALNQGSIIRSSASGAQATNASPAVGAEGNYNSIVI